MMIADCYKIKDSEENNFFDIKKYAGEGTIGYIIEQVKIYRKESFYKTEVKKHSKE